MKVKLLHYTPLSVCSHAIRTCWQSYDKGDNGGEKDIELIDRVGNKNKHSSTLEHLHYNWYIKGISRACLQELARHRMASYSVKSSRYTLKKDLANEESFLDDEGQFYDNSKQRARKYITLTTNDYINQSSIIALENLRQAVKDNISNDISKLCMPESFKTELTWTINARSLQNFLQLRTSKSAFWEINMLAKTIYKAIPDSHKFIFKDCINE